jgi:V/A-type H+/Na+-transporting ATPase subunit I
VIVPMQECTIAVAHRDEVDAREALREAGLVHLAEARSPGGFAVEVTRGRLATVRHAAEVLARAAHEAAHGRGSSGNGAPAPAADLPTSVDEIVADVERLAARQADLRATRAELVHERERLAPFGGFEPAAVRRLAAAGVAVRLVRTTSQREVPDVEGGLWIELARDGHHRTLVLVGPAGSVAGAGIPDEVALPEASLAALAHELAEVEREEGRTRGRLAVLATQRSAIEGAVRDAEEALRFEEARASLASVGEVSLVRGFVPTEAVPRLRELARHRGWGVWLNDVRNADEAPTLVRTPRWAQPIAPVLGFLGVVPAYGHVDISVPFLIFFSLFFAMIVGDAGYGALFLVLTEWGARRWPDAPRRVVTLLRLLSAATIAWGVASGTYFGTSATFGVLPALRLEWLGDERNVIVLAFTVGALHLTLAHAWNAFRFLNTLRALAEAGWVVTTWTMYFLARTMVVGDPLPEGTFVAFGVGVTLIALFTTPWHRLRREWFTHALLPLTLVGSFVDVVSYVRLFAVGAATYAVGAAFNELAATIGWRGPVSGALTALVLFFGHTLNVLLAAMGVLVHGVRLNTLEFAGHLGLPWTGHPYRPFARSAPRAPEGGAS